MTRGPALSLHALVLLACSSDPRTVEVEQDASLGGSGGQAGSVSGGSGGVAAAGGGGTAGVAGSGGIAPLDGSVGTGGIAGTGGAVGCDLSGAGKSKEDIPSSISGTTTLTADKV